MARALPMSREEAYVLHKFHEEAERRCARDGLYADADRHRERCREISAAYWPQDEWERAWSEGAR